MFRMPLFALVIYIAMATSGNFNAIPLAAGQIVRLDSSEEDTTWATKSRGSESSVTTT